MVKIQEIIYQTIQGEGENVGRPASFIRLYGCPVGCWFCDSQWAKGDPPPDFLDLSLSETINHLSCDFVVISGGEPAIHPNLAELVEALKNTGKTIAVETSGIRPLPNEVDWITLSPKEHICPETGNLNLQAVQDANELKLIVVERRDIEYYEWLINGFKKAKKPIYFQREWGTNNLKLLIDLAEKHKVKISTQIKKYMGIK